MNEELIGESPLCSVTLAELQQLWGVAADDPMFMEFLVGPEHVEFLQQHVSVLIDLERYDYFLGAVTTDWEAQRAAGGYLGQFAPPADLPAFPDSKRVKAH